MSLAESRRPARATREPAGAPPGSVPGRGWGIAIRGFAVLGCGFLVLQLYVYSAWLLSGDARSVPLGGDPVATRVWVLLGVLQVVCPLALGITVWQWVVRPWRATGRPPVDAVLIAAWATIYFHDPVINFWNVRVLYNAAAVNLGSWGEWIPGWRSPRGGQLPEPLLVFFPAYAGICFLLTVACCALLRGLRRRWPGVRWPVLTLVAWVAMSLMNLVVEVVWMQTGLWVYPGAVAEFSLFAGTAHQFPAYESLLYGAFWALMALVRYALVTEGWWERMRVAVRGRAVLVALAVLGAANLGVTLLYDVPNGLIAPFEGPYLTELPDYQTTGLCGPDTPMSCGLS